MVLQYFDEFNKQFPVFSQMKFTQNHKNFAVDEFRRFYSIAGTIVDNFQNTQTSIDERVLSHIWLRSVLENYFWMLYIFDEASEVSQAARFDEYMIGFKREYSKLCNDPALPRKSEIEPADPSWKVFKKPKDVNTLLAAIKNDYGDRLNYLYFTYRITSFDTHGKTLKTLFSSAFNKECDFPLLNIDQTIDLISNGYLIIMKKLQP